MGSDALPATTSFGLGGCLVVSTPPFGSPTAGQYECSALDNESATSLESTMAWVGYQQGASAATDLPIIYASFCCGQPPGWPPDETGGGAADLVLAPGETGGRALAVDLTVSYVVGYVENSGGAKQAAEWSQQGIAVLAALGPGDATAYAVNACGQIVGESGQEDLTPGWLAAIATVWVNGTPQALEHLLVPGSPSLRLTSARWINDAGYIGAIGYASGTDGSDTLNEHEYLLVPSPAQPATCS